MLLGVLALGSMNAFAQDKLTDGVLQFTISGTDATITGFIPTATAADKETVKIGEKITNKADNKSYTVVGIADKAFNNQGVKSLDMSGCKIKNLTQKMFAGMKSLKTLKLGAAVETIQTGAFKETALEELDLSATQVTTIDNYFETYCSHIGKYTKAAANAKNVETIEDAGGTPKKAGDLKKKGSTSAGTVFQNYAEVNEYYKNHYPKTAHYPAALVYGDEIPYTMATANTDNYNDFAAAGCVNTGDPVLWTLEDALAWNVATFTDAMYAGYELDGVTTGAYNTATSGTKNIGDVLTAEEAQAYNETLGHTDLAIVGNAKFEWIDENDHTAGTQPVVYTEETAYDYNLTMVAAAHKVGEYPTTPFTKPTSQLAYFTWNNNNVVKPQEGKVMWPGSDVNPDTQVTTPDEYYDEDGAYAANVTLAGSAAVEAGQDCPDPLDPVANKTVKSVKLNSVWTVVNTGAFENLQKLESIDFGKAAKDYTKQSQSIGDRALLGTALTEFSLVGTNVQTLKSDMFVDFDESYTEDVPGNATLTSATFNKVFKAVPAALFAECTALATVTFEERDIDTPSSPGQPAIYKVPFGTQAYDGSAIGEFAFRNTAIEEITIPEALDASVLKNAGSIDKGAFYGCAKLKKFTYMVDNESAGVYAVVNQNAFPGCKDVKYYTTNANVAAYMATTPDPTPAPKNTEFVIASTSGYTTPFVTKPYKNVSGKYYIKYKAATAIRVSADEAKVYDAYTDDTDNTLVMTRFKLSGGYYNIAPGDVVLIITTNKDLKFETKSGITSGSFNGASNALQIAEEDITLTQLDYMAGANKVTYAWVSTATATGFQWITSGTKPVPQGTLYAFAAKPADGARLNVRWLDENGNVEAETTGIESLFGEEAADNEAIFNLQGIQVKGAQKGIFIQNGKKYVK